MTRRRWLFATVGCPAAFAIAEASALRGATALNPQELSVRVDGSNILHFAAPRLHFLSGKSMERLKDGATVAFLGQITLSTDANATVAARAAARFALSYDIWEEKLSVTRFAITRNEAITRTASHLSPQAAEAWCLDQLTLDPSLIAADRPVWIRFELRADSEREGAQVIGEPGINITRLIELFSRPARAQQQRWQLDAGPVRLADIHGRT